ncbi:MAG: hypothetical protein RMZ42_06615 [Nostoc sp. DedQUE05]|nr:hypothetical protein [Nostoc sp. DedQUE05]MDZ8091597.1 hypothetical protein [Nostoc sp. DedQUE05]
MNAPWHYMKCDGVLALFGGDGKSLLWGLCPTYTVTYNILEIRIFYTYT